MLLLSVQGGSGGDEARVRVDAEELVPGASQQTVPDHGVLLWKHNNKPLVILYEACFSMRTVSCKC